MSFNFRGYVTRIERTDEDRYVMTSYGSHVRMPESRWYNLTIHCRDLDVDEPLSAIVASSREVAGSDYGIPYRRRNGGSSGDARCTAHAVLFCGECARTAISARMVDRALEQAATTRTSSAYRGVPDEQMAVRDMSAERERDVALWAAAMVAVLVCLGQLAAERAPPSRVNRFENLEVD